MSTGVVTPLQAGPPFTRRVRAYFAPVNRATSSPAIFDPAQTGGFNLDAPPAPWVDLGWVDGFARKSGTKMDVLRAGSPSVPTGQTRLELEATVSMRFLSWGKLQMALSAGSQHMNLLATAVGAGSRGSGGTAEAATPVLAGSTASSLIVSATQAGNFNAGQMVAVDVDYTGQTGFVGSGVSAAYVTSPTAVQSDVNYIRRVSFNVGRVTEVSGSTIQLSKPLLAGAPVIGMSVLPMLGFVDREGGSFFLEWSGLFVMPGEQGERMIFHYPRLQSLASAAETVQALAEPIDRIALAGNFRALPVSDANDGEQVLCFRSFLPAPSTQLW